MYYNYYVNILSVIIITDKMPNPQSYSRQEAETILDNANSYITSANESSEIANKYINRDANAKVNQYEGEHSQLNNQLVKVGNEYVYITQGGVARKVTGGVGSPWSLQGNAGENDQYSRFSDVPNSNCPADVTVISDFDSINDIKVQNGEASLYKGNPIRNHTLTACGAEGSIVYINQFMDFDAIKIGGDDGFYVGDGNNFIFLDQWTTTDWKTVTPIACKLASQSGYKTVKLVIDNDGIDTPVVKAYVSDTELDSDLTSGKGFRNTYTTSQVGNKVTANSSNCTEEKVATFKFLRNNYDVKIKPGYDNGTKLYDYSDDLFYPETAGVYNVTSKDLRDGIPVGENDVNDSNTQVVQYYYVKNKQHTNSDGDTVLKWRTNPKVNPCSEYTTYTQNYSVTCNEMSDYPYTQHHNTGWTKRLPSELQRCNALFKVWNSGIVNTNIYVGNVGYVTHEGTMQHIAYNLLLFKDNDIDSLITFTGSRVCRNSKQYLSNTNQILEQGNHSLEDAKNLCANNVNCAGFEMIGTSVTFFRKSQVYCGETTATLNSMLPLTEDPYQNYTTVWKPLVLKIKNPNNSYLDSDNINNPSVVTGKNRSKSNLSTNYYQANPSNYTWDVRNITGGCPESVTSGFYGQLWYGYRNNGYSVQSTSGFMCKSLESDTQSKIRNYSSNKLPTVNNYIKNTVVPSFSSIVNRTNKTQQASVIEGITTMEEEYGNEIIGIMNEKLPTTVNYNGINYTITDKNTLDSYSILQGQLNQGIMTSADATIQITNLLNPPTNDNTVNNSDDNSNSYNILDTTINVSEGFTSKVKKTSSKRVSSSSVEGSTTLGGSNSGASSVASGSIASGSIASGSGASSIASSSVASSSVASGSLAAGSGAAGSVASASGGSSIASSSVASASGGSSGGSGGVASASGGSSGGSGGGGGSSGGGLVSIMNILNEDSSIISDKNGYHYLQWILIDLCICLFIVLIAFSIIPALNSKTVLRPLTIGLGSLSLVLVVMKYNLIPVILEFLNYFIYNQ
jgi:hypothetical protein